MRFFRMYGITFIIFLIIDGIWLLFIAKNLYKNHLAHLMAPTPKLGYAALFYLIYIVGLVFFVIAPALDKQSLSYAMLAGALFNLVAYATYDLTNMATLYQWPLNITLIDIAWGTFLGFAVSTLSYYINRLF